MTNLVQWASRSVGRRASRNMPISLDQALYQFGQFGFQGLGYGGGLVTTMNQQREGIQADFTGFIEGTYKSNGAIFACMLVRMLLFSEARFQWRRMTNGRPGDLFGNADLDILENPWPNATTGDLLTRAINDADLSGNFYATRVPRLNQAGTKIARLCPDWVTILKGSPTERGDINAWDPSAELIGYIYQPGGPGSGMKPKTYLPEEVAHFAPIPDPSATYRGMSWIQPVLNEVIGDRAMTTHKIMYFEGAATPNLVVTMDTGRMDRKTFEEWIDLFESEHAGAINAYKTLYLGQGATATKVGADMKDLDYHAVQGAGEPLAVDTPVPTPTGWTIMGQIQAGDEVFGRDGKPIKVLGALPVHYDRDCYRVSFTDGTSIVADAGHVWTAMDRNTSKREEREYTTLELRALVAEWETRGCGGNRIGIPAGQPIELPAVDLLIDPYVLGVWLGDGQTAGAAITGVDPDLGFIQAEFERRGYTTTRWSTAPEKADVFGVPGGLLAALDALGVLGNKHIPDEYLRASKGQRLELLRGLMDTDGSVGSVGSETCEYSSKWEHLARQAAELTRSLGYRASLNFKEDARSRTGGTWRLTFRADPDVLPFLLPRKAERCQTPVHVKNRAIVSIEPVESVPVRCIAVDSPDHLFRAGEGWTLTHNTRIAAAAGVPPVIAGFSEGLASATYSNYAQARRRLADGTLRPLWRNFAGSMATLVPPPGGAELWYDDRDIQFLKDDQKDTADIQMTKATAMRLLVDAGYDPDSVVKAVQANDFGLLTHSGLYSVQLRPPGSGPPTSPTDPQALMPGQQGQQGNGNGNGNNGNEKSKDNRAFLMAQALIAAKSGQ